MTTTLRLSDAIALGRMLMTKVDTGSFCGCAIGMGTAALKGGQLDKAWDSLVLAEATWPWLKNRVIVPAIANNGALFSPGDFAAARDIISRLFINVQIIKSITLDQLIDWVRSVEPVPQMESEPVTADQLTISTQVRV